MKRTSGGAPVTCVQRSHGWSFPDLEEVWRYRELLYFFVWRDIRVRYKQTVLGASWAVIQPLFTMIVFTIFFGHLAKIPSEGIPYPIFAYAALVPWAYFAQSITQASNSLISHQGIITKVYFSRLIIPLSAALSGLLDFAIAFLVLLGMIIFYGIVPNFAMLLVPPLILLSMVTALGVGLWMSALNVMYRDVRYAVPFIVQLWLLATPIAYPSSLVPEAWRTLYGVNPMVGVTEGFRSALLGTGETFGPMFLVSVLVSLLLLATGLLYFQRMERTFADVA